jgi:hypothetical protein
MAKIPTEKRRVKHKGRFSCPLLTSLSSDAVGYPAGMNKTDLEARIRRVEELIAGLCREETLWRDCLAPVLAVDRIEYGKAIHDALAALESARVVLSRMVRGLDSTQWAQPRTTMRNERWI